MTKTGVREYFKDRSVLITGGTGFMGKVLIEKLLRSCPDIKRVFVVCKPKRTQGPEARIQNVLKLPIFDSIRKNNPSALGKVKAIHGDVTQENVGLRPEVLETIADEVTVLFNLAASLRLEASLKTALENNTAGTLKVLELARNKLKRLESFVHVSTLFCHCEPKTVEEKTYATKFDPHAVLDTFNWLDENAAQVIEKRILGPHPNSYTFSKQLTEALVNEYSSCLPVTIVRPAIVTPSVKEPVPGWVDSLNGPVGVLVAGAKGVLRSMLCDGSNTAQVIPVDVAINSIIVAAWRKGTNLETEVCPVYNISCANVIAVTWGEVLQTGKDIGYKYPVDPGLWYPNGTITTNKYAHFLYLFFLQTIPAVLIDILLFAFGQKTFMMRVQKRIRQGLDLLQYFTMRSWDVKTERGLELTPSIPDDEEREIFYISNIDVNLEDYMLTGILGAKQYCLKESPADLNKFRRKLVVYYIVDKLTKMALVWSFFYYVYQLWVTGLYLNLRGGATVDLGVNKF